MLVVVIMSQYVCEANDARVDCMHVLRNLFLRYDRGREGFDRQYSKTYIKFRATIHKSRVVKL